MNNKIFFWEISDLAHFVNYERSRNNKCKMNEDTEISINNIKKLCVEARVLINHINGTNFKETVNRLIIIDAKITGYLFFLIHEEYLEPEKIHQWIEKDSLTDYYVGLEFEDILNEYKLIYYKKEVM